MKPKWTKPTIKLVEPEVDRLRGEIRRLRDEMSIGIKALDYVAVEVAKEGRVDKMDILVSISNAKIAMSAG